MAEPLQSQAMPRADRQIHLTTAVAAMLAASIMVGVNVCPLTSYASGRTMEIHTQGWPHAFDVVLFRDADFHPRNGDEGAQQRDFQEWTRLRQSTQNMGSRMLVYDISIGVGIVLLTSMIVELFLRRRVRS
jgi:hypothetical protein